MTAVIQPFVDPEDWTDHLTWAVLLTLVLIRGPGTLCLGLRPRADFEDHVSPDHRFKAAAKADQFQR